MRKYAYFFPSVIACFPSSSMAGRFGIYETNGFSCAKRDGIFTTVRLIVEQIQLVAEFAVFESGRAFENAWVIGIFLKRVTEKTWSKV